MNSTDVAMFSASLRADSNFSPIQTAVSLMAGFRSIRRLPAEQARRCQTRSVERLRGVAALRPDHPAADGIRRCRPNPKRPVPTPELADTLPRRQGPPAGIVDGTAAKAGSSRTVAAVLKRADLQPLSVLVPACAAWRVRNPQTLVRSQENAPGPCRTLFSKNGIRYSSPSKSAALMTSPLTTMF